MKKEKEKENHTFITIFSLRKGKKKVFFRNIIAPTHYIMIIIWQWNKSNKVKMQTIVTQKHCWQWDNVVYSH